MSYPTPPDNVDKTRYARGSSLFKYKVLDEVYSELEGKQVTLVYFQKIEESNGKIKYRFGAYTLGAGGRFMDKWFWQQNAPLMTQKVLDDLLEKAREKGWFA